MAQGDLTQQLQELKKERNAVILAHSYQRPELQDVADFVGDSLALARYAQQANCETIAFCGVRFMAETACILNPTRKVVLPDLEASCSLELSCPASELSAFLEKNSEKNYYVIAYINCSIGVKALSDVIVTSGNARRIVETAPPDRPILFVPDANLGAWVAQKTGRKMELWDGACHVHRQFTRDSILNARTTHPGAPVVCHPECREEIRALSDHVCSTEQMIGFCRENEASTFIIVTESGILHRLRKLVPDKEFIGVGTEGCSCAECEYMKLNTLEKLRDCLRDLSPVVSLPEELRRRAEKPLLRMLELSQ